MADIAPGMYPRLQQMAQGPMGGLAGWLMQGMEKRRLAAGISPEDWQARITDHFAARHAQHTPEMGVLPVQLANLGGLPGAAATPAQPPAQPTDVPTTTAFGAPGADPTMQSNWITHLLMMLHGGQMPQQAQQSGFAPFGGF